MSELKRTELKRATKPMRRTRIRQTLRRHDPTPEGWRSYFGVCPLTLEVGWVDAHHIVPARVLKRLGLHDHLWDERNRLWIGRTAHDAHTNRSRPLLLSQLPDSAFEFVEELGLGHVLEREYEAAGTVEEIRARLDATGRVHAKGDRDA